MLSFTPSNIAPICLYLLQGALIYWAYQKKNYGLCMGFVLSLGFCLRLFPSLDGVLHEWDERYHAVVAKNMLLHPFMPTLYENPIIPYDYKGWGSNHVWLHKQPLALWFMALSLKIFGLKAWAVRIPSLIFSTLTIGLTYEIGKHLFSKEIGIWAALLLAINGLAIAAACGRTTADHIDTLYFFWISLAIYAVIRFYQEEKKIFLFLIGLSLGFAVLTKWIVALFVLVIFGMIGLQKKSFWETVKFLLILTFFIVLIAFPWQYYIFTHYPQEAQWEFAYNQRHLWEHLEGHNEQWWMYFVWARMSWNEFIYLIALWFCFIFYQNRKDIHYQTVAIWIAIPYIVFTLASTRLKAYVLPTAPAIFMVESLFAFAILAWNKKQWQRVLGKLLIITFWVLSISHSLETLKPFDKNIAEEQLINDLQFIKEKIGNQKAVLFNFYDPYQVLFFTDYVSYYASLDEYHYFINLSKEKGYKIFVWDNENVAEYLRNNPDINIIKR